MRLSATCPLPDAAGGGPRRGRGGGGGVPRVVVGLLLLLLLLLVAGVAALAQLPQHAGPATPLLLHAAAALGVNSPASRVRRSSALHVGQGSSQPMQAGDWILCIYVCSCDGGSSCALGCADQSSAAHRPRCVIRDGRMSLAFMQLKYVSQVLVAFWLLEVACRIV